MLKYFTINLKILKYFNEKKMLKYFTDKSLICYNSYINLKNYIKIFKNFFKTVYNSLKI